jgi:hypothetical protein
MFAKSKSGTALHVLQYMNSRTGPIEPYRLANGSCKAARAVALWTATPSGSRSPTRFLRYFSATGYSILVSARCFSPRDPERHVSLREGQEVLLTAECNWVARVGNRLSGEGCCVTNIQSSSSATDRSELFIDEGSDPKMWLLSLVTCAVSRRAQGHRFDSAEALHTHWNKDGWCKATMEPQLKVIEVSLNCLPIRRVHSHKSTHHVLSHW